MNYSPSPISTVTAVEELTRPCSVLVKAAFLLPLFLAQKCDYNFPGMPSKRLLPSYVIYMERCGEPRAIGSSHRSGEAIVVGASVCPYRPKSYCYADNRGANYQAIA